MLTFSLICKPRLIKQIGLECFKDITIEDLIKVSFSISGANKLSRMGTPEFTITNLTTNQSNKVGWFMLRKYIQILQLVPYDKT